MRRLIIYSIIGLAIGILLSVFGFLCLDSVISINRQQCVNPWFLPALILMQSFFFLLFELLVEKSSYIFALIAINLISFTILGMLASWLVSRSGRSESIKPRKHIVIIIFSVIMLLIYGYVWFVYTIDSALRNNEVYPIGPIYKYSPFITVTIVGVIVAILMFIWFRKAIRSGSLKNRANSRGR